jgi:diguanylate cyclase (GGDEF)-like protein
MKRNAFRLESKLLAAFVLGGLALLAVVTFAAHEGSAYIDADQEIDRLRDLDHAVTTLYLAIRTAESGQRGYLLTGRDSYLRPYRAARDDVARLFADARSRAAGDTATAAALDAMRPRLDAKLAELAQTIDVRKREGFDAALHILLTDRGATEMRAIRELSEQIHGILAARAATAQTQVRKHYVDAVRSLYVVAGLALVMLALIYKAIAGEIDQRRLLSERVRREADHDELTRLPNRRFFVQWLGYALALAQRDNSTLGLLCIDIDGFKAVNDAQGHKAGDALLVEIARRFGMAKRDSDVLARLGGDEFVLAAAGARDGRELAQLAQRLIDALADPPISTPALGASIGIAFFPDDASDPPGLLATADAAIYAAKRAGKNRAVFHAVAELA